MFAGANARTAASASRAPPRAHTSDESGLVDRRRWMSFLTWAFVLGEMVGRDGLLLAAAHAAEDDLGRVSHPGTGMAPIVNNLPNVDVSTATEGPEPITYQHAPTMPSYGPTQLSSELGAAKATAGADDVAHGQIAGGGGGGAGSHADAAPASDGIVDAGVHLSLGDAQFLAFAHDGQPLDLGLHLDPSGLLGDVADGLGGVPLVGGLLEDVGSTLASTTGNLLSLVGLGGDAGAHSYGNDVGTPGLLAFADSSEPTPAHELATPSGYTTYGIALNLGPSDASPVSGEAAAHADSLDASALDNLSDHLPGSHLDTSSDALHLDQSLLRTASDILA